MTGITAETTKRIRPKAPRVTWMIQVRPYGVFVINAEEFLTGGGSMEDPAWIGVWARNEIHARTIGEHLLVSLKGK